MFKKSLLLAAVATFMTAGAANATTLTGSWTSDHCDNSGSNTGHCLGNLTSAGTITVSDTPLVNGVGTLTFTIQLVSGFHLVNTGQDATFGFNLDTDPGAGDTNPIVTYGGIPAGFTPKGGTTTGAANPLLHLDGTGSFEYGVDYCCAPNNPGPNALTFTITGIGLTAASVLQSNGTAFMGIDVLAPTGNTGYLDVTAAPTINQTCTEGTCPVPDGGTTAGLLGLGMLGLGYLRRRIG